MELKTGTYVLLLNNPTLKRIRVGQAGLFTFDPGVYAYVGSAFGPGGLNARVARHRKKRKTKRWHVDYLREKMELMAIWGSISPNKRECEWADLLREMGGLSPFKGLGSSDCQCVSHLFYFKSSPSIQDFKKQAPSKESVTSMSPITD